MSSRQEDSLELLADNFSFPTSLTFDSDGLIYIAESGLPFDGAEPGGRILRLESDGRRTLVAEGLRPPVNGLTFHAGGLYVSEGGYPSRISRFDADGRRQVILDNLPGPGNYHTNMIAFGPDGKLYFSQGAMTNSGIIGLDAYELGWLRRLPHAHDLPGYEIELAGVNVETQDPLSVEPEARTRTGAFAPFGTTNLKGQRLTAQLPCTASVMRCNPDGSQLELVAWGLRNAYGIGFMPDGQLLAIDQGADDRGSRPIGDAPDLLYSVRQRGWYGWPDFIGGEPVTAARFRPERGETRTFVLANHDELPPPERPLLSFPSHTAAVKFDYAPAHMRPFGGQLFVALFGDERPMTAPAGPHVGRGVARIDPQSWSLHPFITGPLVRPIDVRFHPHDETLYIVDFGYFEMDAEKGVTATAFSGKLWHLRLSED